MSFNLTLLNYFRPTLFQFVPSIHFAELFTEFYRSGDYDPTYWMKSRWILKLKCLEFRSIGILSYPVWRGDVDAVIVDPLLVLHSSHGMSSLLLLLVASGPSEVTLFSRPTDY